MAALGFPCDERAARDSARLRLLVAGASTDAVCGVRDHAAFLDGALRRAGAEIGTGWVDQSRGFSAPIKIAQRIWRDCRQSPPDAAILHYSVFALSWRGVPVLVPILSLVLRRLGVPVILFAHEFAYPWGRRGLKGFLQAVTQRLVFISLVAAADALVVTTEDRVAWLRSRWWLPRRPVRCAPVFSNIAVRVSANAVDEVPGRVGVFGFGAEGLEAELVTGAVARAARTVPASHLVLIGGPGPDSPAAECWRRAAGDVGCSVTFTGIGTEEEVSAQLAACEVVFHPDPAGPTSRKTTLAAALSHGRAVIALDGPQRWDDLVEAKVVVIVEPTIASATSALMALLADDERRRSLGAGAAAFAQARLSPERSAEIVLEVVAQATLDRVRP